jgi:hypothetical protein
MGVRRVAYGLLALVATCAFALTACGGDDSSSSATSTTAPAAGTAKQNACPVDGCTITILDVQRSGKELKLRWSANFKPDFSKNHIHVYWDIYTADQVSNDAAKRGVKQGEWVPTDAYPVYVTGGAVSTAKRKGSTKICVTAGDRDHNVIDSSLVNCRDVAGLV